MAAYLGSYDSFFCFSAAVGARKLMKPRRIVAPNFKNPRSFLYRFEHAKVVFMLMVNTVHCLTFREISF